jgi:hypothetical protein
VRAGPCPPTSAPGKAFLRQPASQPARQPARPTVARRSPLSRTAGHAPRRGADGTIFDTTYKRNRPLKFKLGCQQVVEGWDEGVSQLSLGEMATIRMPAAKAWGKTGIPGLIPPNEDLEFEVELTAVQ